MDELDELIKDALHQYCEEEYAAISLAFEKEEKHIFSERFNKKMREQFPFLSEKESMEKDQ